MAKKNESLIGVSLAKHPSGSGETVIVIDVKDHEPSIFGGTDFQNAAGFTATHAYRLRDEYDRREAAGDEVSLPEADPAPTPTPEPPLEDKTGEPKKEEKGK